MTETRKVFDPFLKKEVEIYDSLSLRLRGYYAVGPVTETNAPEFGWRQYGNPPPIQIEAANRIEELEKQNQELINELRQTKLVYETRLKTWKET